MTSHEPVKTIPIGKINGKNKNNIHNKLQCI